MQDALAFVSGVTFFVGVVLAVARDVPILEVFLPRKTPMGNRVAPVFCSIAMPAFELHAYKGAIVFGIEP